MKSAILYNWNFNLNYGLDLVADLSEAQMVEQPYAGMNHPAWILAHLCHYHPLILAIVKNTPCPDPAEHPDAPWFDEESTPISDPSRYPIKTDLVRTFTANHAAISKAFNAMPEERLGQPVVFTRWQNMFSDTATALSFIMLMHESVHLGQLSAWRRVQGLPRV